MLGFLARVQLLTLLVVLFLQLLKLFLLLLFEHLLLLEVGVVLSDFLLL